MRCGGLMSSTQHNHLIQLHFKTGPSLSFVALVHRHNCSCGKVPRSGKLRGLPKGELCSEVCQMLQKHTPMLYERSVLLNSKVFCSRTSHAFIGGITHHGPLQKLSTDMREPKRARTDATGAISMPNVATSSQERGNYYAGRGRVTYVPGEFWHAGHLSTRFASEKIAKLDLLM